MLGSDSRIGGDSVAKPKSRDSRTVAEWLWPLMVGGVALFAISALVYYRINPELEATSFLQHTIVGIYNVFGLAPSVVFFLMVFAWSSIWAVTGILERPLARLGRLLVMALMVAVFLNLRSAGAPSGDHTGALGSWIAERLVIGIGYVFSLVLVGPAMFASLMLATDWFFSEWFERDRKSTNFEEGEEGVEDGVTDHLRRLSGVASRPESESESESEPMPVAGAATAVDAAVGDDGIDQSEIAEQLQRAAAVGMSSIAEDVEIGDAGGDAVIVPTRPLSYSGRRLQRAERRAREGEAIEAQGSANIQSESAEAVSVPPPSPGAVMVTEEELESLFDGDAVAAPDQADTSAVDDDMAEDIEASLAAAEDDEDDVDAESEDEAEDESEEDDELEDDDESEEDDELEDDEESEEDGELEDDEESEEDDELEDDEEFDEDEEEFDEELEDDEGVDEGESVDESETEYAEFDGEHEAAEDFDVDNEVFVTNDGLEPEGAASEEESFVTESSAPVEEFVAEDLPSAAEPAVAVVDEQIEQEEIVSIPRPDEVPAVARLTPPAVRDSEEALSTRQQKLFGSQVDDDLMVEAVELVNSGRRTTATLLQRKLRIDYELAVEVLSELTTRGLVSDDHDRN